MDANVQATAGEGVFRIIPPHPYTRAISSDAAAVVQLIPFAILNFGTYANGALYVLRWFLFKKYKTFSVLIYSYINTSGNWKNEKLCGNTTPAGRSVFTQFRVFPIFTSVDITVYQYGKNVLYFFYNIAQRTLTEEWREIFRVDIELYQHGS